MKGTSTLDRPAPPRPGVLDLDRNLAEMAPAVRAAEDCLSYKPGNLSIITLIRNGRTSYTVRDGSHWITNYPTFTDAVNAMEYMAKFNTICFTGRGTPSINYWFEKR
ncbi:MAG: hypothetical protein ACLGIO_01440 [Acidimicrobiia bacterium]